jgi:D-alanyl-D-alanine carboxypeptidase
MTELEESLHAIANSKELPPWEPENVIVTLFDKDGRSRQEKHNSLMDYYNNHVTQPQLYQDISMIVITSQSFHDELEDVRQAQNPTGELKDY